MLAKEETPTIKWKHLDSDSRPRQGTNLCLCRVAAPAGAQLFRFMSASLGLPERVLRSSAGYHLGHSIQKWNQHGKREASTDLLKCILLASHLTSQADIQPTCCRVLLHWRSFSTFSCLHSWSKWTQEKHTFHTTIILIHFAHIMWDQQLQTVP